ncbi:zinc-ribbon domain-containing protein [Candidatus Phycosocius spiralis]|nr:zinc-ribbon domain-containing protein [Candidatus Phycosocius spiralis]
MQLICPTCNARYNVAESAVPPTGRTTRCSACGTKWWAKPPIPEVPAGKPSKAEVKAKLAALLSAAEKAKQAARSEPSGVAKRKAQGRIKLLNSIAITIPWLLAACMLAGAIVTAITYRSDIVRLWPKTATLYAKLGVPANLYGVDIQSVIVTTTLEASGPRIEIKGILKSVSRRPEFVPYIRLSLVDPTGREQLTWMIDPGVEILQPGVAHRFSSARTNPIRGPLNAVLVFAEPPRKGPVPTLLPPPRAESATFKPAPEKSKSDPKHEQKQAPTPKY